jgi:hypothetical protein
MRPVDNTVRLIDPVDDFIEFGGLGSGRVVQRVA